MPTEIITSWFKDWRFIALLVTGLWGAANVYNNNLHLQIQLDNNQRYEQFRTEIVERIHGLERRLDRSAIPLHIDCEWNRYFYASLVEYTNKERQ